MAHAKNHDYHILPPSIWPLLSAVGAFTMLFGAALWMKDMGSMMFFGGLIVVLYCMYGWWGDMVHEGQVGDHTPVVRIGLRYGFILFIMSEVMFFSAWFWTFFKHALYPMGPESPLVDGVWPPAGIETFDPWHLPLINTVVLLLSGVTLTWAHHALVHENNRRDVVNGLIRDGDPGDQLYRASGVSNTATPPLALPATSMAPASSWRPGSTGCMSSSARSFWRSACCG